MKKSYLIALALVAGITAGSWAQSARNCGTMHHLSEQIKNDPDLQNRMDRIERATEQWVSNPSANKGATVITIPVVVHVVYNTAAQNISDAQVQSQIDVLNEDFRKLNADVNLTPGVFSGLTADCQIQFCLAQRDPNGLATNGIHRVSTTSASFSSNDNIKRAVNGGADAWNSTQYLNLWSGNLSGGLLGYAQFPGGTASTDGVVILFSAFGRVGTVNAPYNKGRTATHEVGHWLNLRHIWGDANCGSDLVNDTPTSQTSNFGCPSFPHVTCSNGPNGDMFMNYMDYTDDACMFMFTTGQSSRMNAAINTSRASLLTSLGCTPPSGGACTAPTGLASSGITTSTATVSWGAASGAVSYNLQYRVNGNATWTTVSNATTSKSLTGLVANTIYNYQVQTVCASSTSAYSAASNFTTLSATSCGTPAGLSASSVTTSGATLNWAAVSGASSYNVQYRIVGSATWTSTTSATTSKAVAALAASSNYEFQVQAVCTGGSGVFSASGTFTTASAGCTDVYEPNNSKNAGKTIAVNTNITGLISSTTDKDWFKFSTVAGSTNIKVVLDLLAADYDLKLYNSSGSQLAISQLGGTSAESITRNTSTAASYYVQVYGYSGANSTTCYRLRINAGATPYRLSSDENIEGNINLEKTIGFEEVNLFPNPASNMLNVNYFIDNTATVNISVLDMLGKSILNEQLNSEEGFNQTSLDMNNLNSGIYFLKMQQNDQVVVKKFIVKH